MNLPELPPTFRDMETRLTDLRARYQRGELNESTYQAAVQELKVQDSSGRTWWLGGELGAWHLWDGKKWIRSNPPLASKRTLQKAISSRRFRIGCGIVLLLVGLLIVVAFIGGWQSYLQEPKVVEGIQPDAIDYKMYSLSPDQSNLITRLDYPEAFSIIFYGEEQEDGSFLDIRFETWTYYSSGVEYTFINGNEMEEDPIEIELLGELIPIPYRPEQFVAYMSLDELINSADLETYLVVPLERELVDGGQVFFADELTFGLKHNELLYIEALALEIES